MQKSAKLVILIATLWSAVPAKAQDAVYKKTASSDLSKCMSFEKDLPLPGKAARLDYQSIDSTRSLLFIAQLGDNSVSVVNLKSSSVKYITNIPRPHGILAVPGLNRVYVSATGVNQVFVVDEVSLQIVAKIPAGDYPDGLDFDPNTNRIFVSDEHGGTVSVIDVVKNSLVATIKMGGEVGNTHYDPVSGIIYSAVQTTDELVGIDPKSMSITSRFKLPGCQHAHGFLIDPETHYAFITGEDNAGYVVFDLAKKQIIGSGKVGKEPDVLAFDSGYHLLFVSSESGVVSVFILEKGNVRKLSEGFLAPHAHTVAVDSRTHKVYFPLQDIGGKPVLRVFDAIPVKK
jgi:YVTN family beta-propeller protein